MKEVDLINGKIGSSLRRFSAPLTISFLIHILYAWVDMYYVSRIGYEAMAAVGVGEQILFFAFGIGMGISVGTGIIVARRIGEGDNIGAGKTAMQGLFFTSLIAIAISVTLYLLKNVILDIMSMEDAVRRFTDDYMTLIIFGLPFSFLVFQINSMIRSAGNSFIPMIILITANVINAILSPFFIFGIGPFPEWGVFGAAFATILAQFLGLVFAIIILINKFKKIHIDFKNFKVDFSIFRKILKLGVPASLQLIVISLNRISLTWVANIFGTSVLTTYMLGLRVDMFVFMTIFAVGAALEIITGQNLGAKRIERIEQFYFSAIKQVSVIMIGLGIAIFFFGKYIAMIFTNEVEIINMVEYYLKINSFSYVFFSIGIFSIRVLSGAGDYMRSLILVVIILYVFQLPLVYVISILLNFQYHGIWYGIFISQILFALFGFIEFRRKRWLNIKL